MKVSTKRDFSRDPIFEEVGQVTIQIGETRYRIEDNKEGGLCINKVDFNDSSIQITPRVSNEIFVK